MAKEIYKAPKGSYTDGQKATIIASMQGTIDSMQLQIEILKKAIEEVKNAPSRQNLIGEEVKL